MKISLGVNNTKVELSLGFNLSAQSGEKTIDAGQIGKNLQEAGNGLGVLGKSLTKSLIGNVRKAVVTADDRVNGR